MSVAVEPANGAAVPRRGLRLTPRAAVLAIVVMALLLYAMVPLRSYLEQRSRLAQLERQTQVLERQRADLLNQIAQLQDPSYLQRIARECLGLVRPGEIAFVIVPKTEASDLPGC